MGGAGLARVFDIQSLMMLGFIFTGEATTSALAHEGPPFPILVDRRTGSHIISVWADPDIGEAKFYVVVECVARDQPGEIPRVSMWVQPVTGRIDRAHYEAEPQVLQNRIQYKVEPHFDQQDTWNVGIQLVGANESDELLATVESTPPGYGLWDFAIYIFPFGLIGILWVVGMSRRRASGDSMTLFRMSLRTEAADAIG
jgi:hypothetical protein